MLMRLNWEHFEGLVLCFKKQVAAQPPDVGALGMWLMGLVSAMPLQVTARQRETMTCFPKTASREGAQWLSCSTCTEEVKFGNDRKDLS